MTKPQHSSDPLDTILNALRQRGSEPRETTPGTWKATCPCHGDDAPSLSITLGDDGRVLLHCHAGCPPEKIVQAIGLTMADLFPKGQKPQANAESAPASDSSQPARDWAALDSRFKAAATEVRVGELAEELGVTSESLRGIDVGWAEREELAEILGKPVSGPGWTFPERDGAGKIIGISIRGRDGGKWSLPGSKRGLIIPAGLDKLPDPVLIVEGASDVAACLTLGLAAVGRPSNKGGVDELAQLLGDRLKGRDVLVVGENDADWKTGKWPGHEGAVHVAAELTERLGKDVKWTLPPPSPKDVREVLGELKLNLSDRASCQQCGPQVMELFRDYSFPPPIESEHARKERWEPIPLSQLGEGEAIDWLWEGFLAPEHITLLSGFPKAGKTTLLAHLCRGMGDGGDLAGSVGAGHVLVVSEESDG
ncbi:MAG: AAA family ATPase, partial [Armatimonadetes bacterium]|nr:AAA family ATPase [Armatimonadota bacterium]